MTQRTHEARPPPAHRCRAAILDLPTGAGLSGMAAAWQHVVLLGESFGACMTTQRRSYESGHKPKCLVVVDDTAEWDRAVYYASRWAMRVGGGVVMLRIIETEDQNQQWLGVADIMRAEALEDANAALDRAVSELAAPLGVDLVSTDGAVLEAVAGELLLQRGWWVAFAESCTGGLATSRMTDVPGSSAYVERSIVAYSNRAKMELLDVPELLIAEHGAVSEPVAVAMADGIRKRAKVNVGVGITGIAGPGGGSEQKPVGTVCIAVAGPDAQVVRTFRFPPGRDVIKGMSANWAIDMLRRFLLKG